MSHAFIMQVECSLKDQELSRLRSDLLQEAEDKNKVKTRLGEMEEEVARLRVCCS